MMTTTVRAVGINAIQFRFAAITFAQVSLTARELTDKVGINDVHQ